MSAFYAVAYGDRIELLTDGAIYTDDGTLVGIHEKYFCSDYVPLAITGRGEWAVVEAFASAIVALSACGSFDRTIDLVAEFLNQKKTAGVPAPCEIIVTGISETDGPTILYFSTTDAYNLPGFEPWTLFDVGQEWGGGSSLGEAELAGIDASAGLADCGVALFEAMRRKPGVNPIRPDLPQLYGIGGHVDLTTITKDGCVTRRLRVWPDIVGEKIAPLAAERKVA